MRRFLTIAFLLLTPTGLLAQVTGRRYGGASPNANSGNIGVVPNPQTGTSYTIASTDRGGYITFSNASAIAVTLPQAGTAGFLYNIPFRVCDIGAGTATITPTTSTISYTTGTSYTSAATSMALTTGQCATIMSDNTNYFANQYIGGSGGGGVNTCGSSGTFIAIYASTTTVECSLDSIDSNGNLIFPTPSGISYGTTTQYDLACVTASGTIANCTTFPANNFLGVFATSTGGIQQTGFGTVNLDAKVNVTYGDILCASSSTATAHDNGSTPCANGEWIGIATITASSVTSTKLFMRLQ